MLRYLLLLLCLIATPLWAQDIRPSAYLGQAGKVTVRSGKVLGSTGGVTTIAEQTITPANSATTYIYIDLSSTPAVATSTSGFPSSNYFPICTVIKDANGIITSFTDSRPDFFMSGSGSGSPSSLTTFFNKYYGLAPQDYGAKGDTHVFFDCGMTTNNHVTCASSHFTSADVGKWFESCAANCNANNSPTINKGTITVFNSATDVTVSVSAGTTYTNTRTGYGTDDNAAMQLWGAAIVQAAVNGVPPLTRGGYLPAGGYAVSQPILIVYPGCTTPGVCTAGEGGPNAGATGTLRPSLWIAGQGTASTFLYVRTAGTFTWPTQASDTAVLFVKDFDFSSLTNFGIVADGSAHNTTSVTSPGTVALLTNSNSTHAMWSGLWMQGFHNTSNKACGFITSANDFESSYSYSAVESNDINGCLGAATLGANQTMEKISLVTNFFENPNFGQNIQIGDPFNLRTVTLKQINFTNVHTIGSAVASINFLSSVSTSLGDTFQIHGFRQQSAASSGGLGMVVNTTTGLNVDCHGCYFEETGAGAGNLLIDNTSANATFNLYGGSLQCASCTNAFNNVGNIFVYGTKLTGPSVANIQTGAGNTYSFIPVAGANGGWSGKGGIQGTWIVSNQGAVCTNGELALSAGWQSTGSATVTGVNGTGQTCSWTITTGTTTAANPTVTDTLTNALPTATIACELNIHGGTHTAVAGENFQQTTLSATAPVFTSNFTPTAGGTTYFVTRRCGP